MYPSKSLKRCCQRRLRIVVLLAAIFQKSSDLGWLWMQVCRRGSSDCGRRPTGDTGSIGCVCCERGKGANLDELFYGERKRMRRATPTGSGRR